MFRHQKRLTPASARGHVFVVMLAYLIERELANYWKEIDTTVAEGIDELGALCDIIIKGEPADIQKLPRPNELCGRLFEAADVRLPQVLPLRNAQVATRQKLAGRRKKIQKISRLSYGSTDDFGGISVP